MTLHSLLVLIAFVANALGLQLTHFGYPGDPYSDSNSAQGIGAFNDTPGTLNAIGAGRAVALSPDVVQQYGLQPNQQFTATAGGQTFEFVYADKTRPDLTGRIDVFDPSGSFSLDGAQVTSVQGGPVLDSPAGGGVVDTTQAQTLDAQVVNPLLAKFQNASAKWSAPLTKAATFLFWTLAVISLVWTGVGMFARGTTLAEIVVELVRYIMVTGLFFWFLTNGSVFALDIINSLRQLGGEASGTGKGIVPSDLVTIGLQLINAQNNWIRWIFPAAAFLPSLIAGVVLIVCILISANMVLLIISAWVVSYAGVIVLGFGASPWTRDIAINYLRTALGVGIRLMVMKLVIGLGIEFLNTVIQEMGGIGSITNVGALSLLAVAVIMLAVIAHRLPLEVAGMVTGAGYHGGIGTMGVMSAIGAAIGMAGLARGVAGGVAGIAGAAGMSAAEKLEARIAAAAETTSAGHNGNGATYASSNGSSRMASTVPSSSTSGRPAAPTSPPPAVSMSQPATTSPVVMEAEAIAADEMLSENPVLPDETRGFEPPPFFYPDEPV